MTRISPDIENKIRAFKAAHPEASTRTIGDRFGVHKSTVSNVLHRPENEQPSPGKSSSVSVEPIETNEIKGDEWTITLPKTDVSTLEQLVERCNIDLSVWQVDRWIANKWAVGAKDANGDIQVTPLYQVKAFLKRKKEVYDAKLEIEALKAKAKENARAPYTNFMITSGTDNMLEINVPDLHAGKLAWGQETGGANYDTQIAVDTFNKALETLLYRVREHKFDQVLFVLGNDLLNSDNQAGTTTGGTYVNTDVRYQKTFTLVRNMKIDAIERLRQVAPVKVVPVGGNHDQLSIWHLGSSLECYFHKYKDVLVDNSPRFRKYHEFGKVMLMMCHGHKGKRPDYPLTMSTEQPEMFGRTKFREAHTGHLHGLDVKEYHGVRVRILSALCPEDSWHSENNFIGNLRSAEAFVWNKEEGMIGSAIYNEVSD